MIKSYKDLDVHKRSYDLAMEMFFKTKSFPKAETYSLTSQIVRSSRSVSSNIAEGWAKRKYENIFKQHLITAIGSCAETENWISFAKDCKYIDETEYEAFREKIETIGKMLSKLHQNWKTL
jgi:four helix bundle protein